MAKLLSGKVGVTSYAGLSTERQQTTGFPSFLGLEEAEPNLGLPSNNDYVLYGDVNGKRFWGAPSGAPSGSVDGITVEDEGIAPVGFGGSVTRVNFVGNGVEAVQTKQTIGGVEVGVATVSINKSTNDVMDANGFTRITGVTTFKVGAGLSFVELPPGEFSSGIVSIFSQADAKLDFQDDRGFPSFQNIGVFRVGAGLTITNPVAGVASVSPTGNFNHIDQIVGKHISITGASTATSGYFGNLTGNVTGNLTGNVTGNVQGNLTGDVTGNLTGNMVGNASGDHDGSFTGNVNGQFNQNPASGISTIGELRVDTVFATGNIDANGDIDVDGHTNLDNVSVAGVTTFAGRIEGAATNNVIPFLYNNYSDLPSAGTYHGAFAHVHSFGKAYYAHAGAWFELVNKEADGRVGTGTETYNVGNIVSSGIITATGGFVGGVTGNLTGAASQIAVTDESTVANCNVIYASGGPTGNLQPKSGTNLTFNSSNGTLFATKFSGDASLLTSVPASQLTGTVAVGVDGSNLTNLNAATVDLVATNTTSAGHFITFVDTATGSETIRTDTDFTYNPGTNTITVGAINGNATGLTGNPNITVGNILPAADDTHDIGSSTLRWKNIHSMDLQLNNEGSKNDVDGTWGNWTIQEGETDLFLLNNRSGKKYKFNLTEVS